MKPELQKFVGLAAKFKNKDDGVWIHPAIDITAGDLRALVEYLKTDPGSADYHRGYDTGFKMGRDSGCGTQGWQPLSTAPTDRRILMWWATAESPTVGWRNDSTMDANAVWWHPLPEPPVEEIDFEKYKLNRPSEPDSNRGVEWKDAIEACSKMVMDEAFRIFCDHPKSDTAGRLRDLANAIKTLKP